MVDNDGCVFMVIGGILALASILLGAYLGAGDNFSGEVAVYGFDGSLRTYDAIGIDFAGGELRINTKNNADPVIPLDEIESVVLSPGGRQEANEYGHGSSTNGPYL